MVDSLKSAPLARKRNITNFDYVKNEERKVLPGINKGS